jgi:inner membrane protein
MLPLGHMGITLGAALLPDALASRWHGPSTQPAEPTRQCVRTRQSQLPLVSRVDLRLLLLGSLLPDIIDKPVGQVIFQDTFNNGRIFCHTLLFVVLVALAGFFMYRRRRATGLLAISFGVFMHVVLDGMWFEHEALLWPFWGWAFPERDLDNYLGSTLDGLISNPATYVPELIGGLILACFALLLVRRNGVRTFVKRGRLDSRSQ